jgi:predicted transcriptional regulator
LDVGKFLPISDPIEIAAEIVAAFISNNSVPMIEVPGLIESVHAALSAAPSSGHGSAAVDGPIPAVSIRKSITPDYLICLDDGKRYKSLRRHLTLLGMTPDQYRQKWGLPLDYPMVAANYAAKRSEMARSFGLGRKVEKPVSATEQATGQRKVGRPRKATA